MQAWADRATCAERNAPAPPAPVRLCLCCGECLYGSQNTQYEINK